MINIPYNNPRFMTLQEEQHIIDTEATKKHYFLYEEGNGLCVEKEDNPLLNILKGKKNISESIIGLQHASSMYMQYAQYILNTQKDENLIEDILQISIKYNVFFLKLMTHEACLNSKPISQESMTYSLALVILSKEQLVTTLLPKMILNIEKKNLYIYNDENTIKAPMWFMLSFYAKVTNSDFILLSLQVEKVSYPYNDILKEWDSEDMSKIELWIFLLCEVHIELTRENEFYNNKLVQLFPYEILTWLKLRELKGLKNPTEFSHPLMNTPIAKMFLEIKDPLTKPIELPFAKELLEKLKEKCPNVEIPEWLDGEEASAEENKPSDNIIPDDFMG